MKVAEKDNAVHGLLPGYEVEFIAHRPGGKGIGSLTVREWNINALPLPFVNILTGFTQGVKVQGFTIRIPIPEAYFMHKLIAAPRRMTGEKRAKDLEQCVALISVLDDERLREVMRLDFHYKGSFCNITYWKTLMRP